MLSNVFKLLFLAMAFMCVTARPEFEDFRQKTEADETDMEVLETEQDETDNVEMDGLFKKQTKLPKSSAPCTCPFDCGKVAIVKYPFIWNKPAVEDYLYFMHPGIYKCCREACEHYQNCLSLNKPEWLCYPETLDYICKCRSITKPNIKVEVKDQKGNITSY